MTSSRLSKWLVQAPGLPFATLMALLLAALLVSLLSSYDAEMRWLRFGSIVLAIGIAMWLPAREAVAWAIGVSLVSGLLRGGLGEAGLLRWETLLEAPGLAAAALFTVVLREQISYLVTESGLAGAAVPASTTAPLRPLRPVPLRRAESAPTRREAVLSTATPALVVEAEPDSSLLPFHRDESLASYATYLACLQLELSKTAQIIREVRACPGSDLDLGFESDPTEPYPAAVMQRRMTAHLAL